MAIPDEYRDEILADPLVQEYLELQDGFWYKFQPRPDRPEDFDQQFSFCNNRDAVAFLIGGNAAGCLGAEQEVYDPVARQSRRVSEIDSPFHVWALDRSGATVVAAASKPRIYGTADLYEATLSNGHSFVVTLGHRLLCRDGDWRAVRDVFGEQNGLVQSDVETRRPWNTVTCLRFLRRDAYWDFSVDTHENYWMAGAWHHNTTEAAAYKTAQFVLNRQPPPRKDTPFWVVSETYEQTCDTCWKEKLLGNGHIPPSEVEWDRIRWLNRPLGWPLAVPLKPWHGDPGKNWMLEFKSYKQGWKTLQARSIGGFWFSEQFPWALFIETLRGCRNYMFAGAQFAEFTPLDPELSLQIEKVMEHPPEGWRFYRANTERNRANLADGWYDNFFATVSEEMRATRQIGTLAGFEGIIYPAFSPDVHVVGDEIIDPYMPGVWHRRGVDWGASEEHPFTCVWGYRDGMGDWCIYDEYWSTDQEKITQDHAKAIQDRWPWPEGDPHFGQTFADPSRPGEINEFNIRGIPTSMAVNDIYKGIETVRKLLKVDPRTGLPRLYIHQRCKHLIEELRKYRWKRGRKPTEGSIANPQVAKPEPLKRDDDVVDACRYLLHSDESGRGATPDSLRHADYRERRGMGGLAGDRASDVIRASLGRNGPNGR